MLKNSLALLVSFVACISVCAVEAEVKPKYKTQIKFTDGIAGKALLFNTKSRLLFPLDCIKANCGTIELWVKTKSPEKTYVPLISVGKNVPMWFLSGFDSKGINFLYKRKEGAKYKYYASLKQAYKFEDKWTQFALVWAYNGPGQSLVQIYINGKSIMGKFNMTSGQEWFKCQQLGIACNTASANSPSLVGAIDELRISNYPKTPSEILKAYKQVQAKQELKLEPGTLLLNNFSDSVNGKSMTTETLKEDQVKEHIEKILNELYPED